MANVAGFAGVYDRYSGPHRMFVAANSVNAVFRLFPQSSDWPVSDVVDRNCAINGSSTTAQTGDGNGSIH